MNNSVHAAGQVALLDFGEITTDKQHVMLAIDNERWTQAYSYRHMPPDVQIYYREQMSTMLSNETLDRSWQSALQSQGLTPP